MLLFNKHVVFSLRVARRFGSTNHEGNSANVTSLLRNNIPFLAWHFQVCGPYSYWKDRLHTETETLRV